MLDLRGPCVFAVAGLSTRELKTMGQNNDPIEHDDVQGQQGGTKGKPRSSYLPDGKGQEPFQKGIPLSDESDAVSGGQVGQPSQSPRDSLRSDK